MQKSELINELAIALCKAQAQFGPLRKGADNPFFKSKYADLSSVIDVAREPLYEMGLSFTQTMDDSDSGSVIVETTLMHSSGQWITGRLKMPTAKSDPQGYGSAITYARRYALQAILGLAAEDDDAEGAMQRGNGKAKQAEEKKPQPPKEDISKYVAKINACSSLEALGEYWKSISKEVAAHPKKLAITDAKDRRKTALSKPVIVDATPQEPRSQDACPEGGPQAGDYCYESTRNTCPMGRGCPSWP